MIRNIVSIFYTCFIFHLTLLGQWEISSQLYSALHPPTPACPEGCVKVPPVLCSDRSFEEGPLLISPSHCDCPPVPSLLVAICRFWVRLGCQCLWPQLPRCSTPEVFLSGVLLPYGPCQEVEPEELASSSKLVFLPCFPKLLSKLSSNPILPLGSGFQKRKARLLLLLILSRTSLPQVMWGQLPAQIGNKQGKLQITLIWGRNVCFFSFLKARAQGKNRFGGEQKWDRTCR